MSLEKALTDCPRSIELPEIGIHIAKYLTANDLSDCVRVNKTWNLIFLPFLWKNLQLEDYVILNGILDKPTIEKHSCFIRLIAINNTVCLPGLIPTCPNLHTIEISLDKHFGSDSSVRDSLPEILALNPTVTRFKLSGVNIINKDILSKLPKLRYLEMFNVNSIKVDHFLRILEMGVNQLESITISRCRIEVDPEIMDENVGIVLDRVKELVLEGSYFSPPYNGFSLAKQCPNLETFRYSEDRPSAAQNREFVRLMADRTWPKLSRLSYDTLFLSDHGVAKVMKTMERCYQWVTRGCAFGQESFQVFKGHFPTLTDINLLKCPLVESKMLQEILASCPQLVFFRGSPIMVEDIASGDQWACLSLKIFEALIEFQGMRDYVSQMVKYKDNSGYDISTSGMFELDSKQEAYQRIVFEQFSRLQYLEHLTIGHEVSLIRGVDIRQGLDLRLGKGLELLSNLASIEMIDFQGTIQFMGEREENWMLEHWRCLKIARGRGNYRDSKDFSNIFIKK